MTTLPVSEVFGPTFQGEGPYAGRRAAFVRLGLCNLSCSWCDTPYTWDSTRYDVSAECPDTPISTIHDRLRVVGTDLVILSGGEPLIHRALLDQLMVSEWVWHAETNGTIPPPDYWQAVVEHTTVSPKINTSDPYSKRIKPRTLELWNELADKGRAAFKFVCSTPSDLDRIQELADALDIAPGNVWVMPEGVTPDALMRRHQELAQGILDHQWNTSTRLHIMLYGQERGR